jgi:uncharacterized protein (DUF1697 family)
MDSCGIAQDLIVRSALTQALIAELPFARDLISDGACVRHTFLRDPIASSPIADDWIADDFPDPWDFSDCEDGLT